MRRLFDLLLLLLMGISFSNQSSAMMNIVDTGQQYDVNYIASDEGTYGYDTAPDSQHCCLTSLTAKAQERSFLAFIGDFLVTKGTISRSKSLSTIRQVGPDESFVRFESADVRFSKITSQGGLKPGSFAAPTSELPVPLSQRATRFNLPDRQIPRTRQLNIRAPGDLIIGPRPVMGGTGNEVLFPFGIRPGTVR